MPFSIAAATRLGCLTASCLTLTSAWAQTAPSSSPEALADPARISERVRREADRPYHWIRLQAQRQPAPAAVAAGAQPTGAVATRERAQRTRSEEAPATSLALSGTTPASRGGSTGPSRRDAASGADTVGDLLRSLDDQPPAAGPSASPPVTGAPGALSTSVSPARPESPGSAPVSAASESPPNQPTPEEAGPASPAAGSLAMPAPSLAPGRPAAGPVAATPAPGAIGQGSAAIDPSRGPAETALAADSRLALLKQEAPAFPSYWTQRLRRGEVELKFEVAPDGQVRAASVVKSSHPQLRRAALEAVQQWRFAPISAAREAVVTVGFDLDQ